MTCAGCNAVLLADRAFCVAQVGKASIYVCLDLRNIDKKARINCVRKLVTKAHKGAIFEGFSSSDLLRQANILIRAAQQRYGR